MGKVVIALLAVAVILLGVVLATTGSDPTHSNPTGNSGDFNVHFFYAGQGDCILIDYKDYECLIDTSDGSVDITSLIRPYVQGNIEDAVATHPHADHTGGFPAVFDTYKIDNFWQTDYPLKTQAYKDLMVKVASENGMITHIAKPDDVVYNGNFSIKVLETGDHFYKANDSVVLLATFGQNTFLFMGDTEADGEKALMPLFTDVNVLKVGHHGSCGATMADFLNVIRPEIAVYSCGIGNGYSFPCWATIDRLEAVNADIYGTDVNGSITISSNGEKLVVTTENSTIVSS